jgi:hypothetical protein
MDSDNFGTDGKAFDAGNFGTPAPRAGTPGVESDRAEQRVETPEDEVARNASFAATLRILIPVLLILGMIAAGYGKTPDKRGEDAQSSSNFSRCTLPEGPLGSASTILSTLGVLYAPSSSLE